MVPTARLGAQHAGCCRDQRVTFMVCPTCLPHGACTPLPRGPDESASLQIHGWTPARVEFRSWRLPSSLLLGDLGPTWAADVIACVFSEFGWSLAASGSAAFFGDFGFLFPETDNDFLQTFPCFFRVRSRFGFHSFSLFLNPSVNRSGFKSNSTILNPRQVFRLFSENCHLLL